ncbi:hypothetical protein [Spirosoma luteum]|uniref:hypothetical protein n=1 Tax=Spirosoma luteum TaxID=431553 RepID=UPI000378FDA0|nr:hypothetical protein [Spirosoma luteum]
MELSDELLEQIGAYLSGTLSADEKDRFETQLRQNEPLRQEVALQRELKQGLTFLAQKERFRHMHADLDKRGLLADLDKPTAEQETPKSLFPEPVVVPFPTNSPLEESRPAVQFVRASWVMAASVAMLLGVGWVLYQNQQEKRALLAQEQLFTDFYSTTLKAAPSRPTDPDRVAAPIPNSQSFTDSVRLQAAIAGLQRPNRQPAINDLVALSAGQPGHWRASAQWYLALAYLQNNQIAEAQALLQTIARLNGHPYQQEARQLLTRLPGSTTAH